jgi:hypothetical protein
MTTFKHFYNHDNWDRYFPDKDRAVEAWLTVVMDTLIFNLVWASPTGELTDLILKGRQAHHDIHDQI